jgi:FdrA protein
MLNKARVRRDMYFDSVTLMKVARILAEMEGIEEAAAIMATPANLQLLEEAGLTPFEERAGPNDVLLVVRASDENRAEAALTEAAQQLAHPLMAYGESEAGEQRLPRSLESAVGVRPGAGGIATISVPGPYAALEAERALRGGLDVFLFSDNVPLEDEVALKALARERGLLLMGPDCGTARLDGVGLGFVNVVPPGPIGIVGASGTGIQQVMSLIAQQRGGVSQVIGCGSRDLSEAVGGITTLQGLRRLQEDEQTEVIVLISKPPAPAVAERVLDAATQGKKPVIVIFVGADTRALQDRYGHRVVVTSTLTEAAQKAVSVCGGSETLTGTWRISSPALQGLIGARKAPPQGMQLLSGLFSGGTLCDEAMHIWSGQLGPVYSNIPLDPAWRLPEGQRAQGHRALDFGADEYTRGRPHPMIDPSLRLKRLQEEAGDPRVGVILLDIVLGYCSHPDPAAVYAPAIRAAVERARLAGGRLQVVVSLCGTEGDPQRLSTQTNRLREVGAQVFTSNADAAQRCIELIV